MNGSRSIKVISISREAALCYFKYIASAKRIAILLGGDEVTSEGRSLAAKFIYGPFSSKLVMPVT